MRYTNRAISKEGFAQLYKYMRIYLWSALRIMVLRKRDLIADLRCLLTRQEDGGQELGDFGGFAKINQKLKIKKQNYRARIKNAK